MFGSQSTVYSNFCIITCMKKLLIAFILSLCMSASTVAEKTVFFVDVGQGDCTLVLSAGETLVIDAGPSSGRDELVAQLGGAERIDVLVLTHPHEDHDANFGYLVDNYEIGKLYMPQYVDDEEDYGGLLRRAVGHGTQIRYPAVGDQFSVGDVTVTVLSASDPAQYPDDKNLWSIVLKIVDGDTSIIVAGDAEDINEYAMIDAGLDLDADILRVGHYGSSTSTSGAFLDAVTPNVAVISCGADNSYGHSHSETLDALHARGIGVLRTDVNGTIRITDGVAPKAAVAASTPTPEEKTLDYVLNKNTKKFHYPDCSSVDSMKKKNRLDYTGAREDVIAKGYDPCGRCKP